MYVLFDAHLFWDEYDEQDQSELHKMKREC